MERRNTLVQFRLTSIPSFLAVIALAISAAAQTNSEEASIIATLKAGNERYVTGKVQPKDFVSERPKLVKEQHPYAIVLACADSRVPPELVFDETIGRLFVVRTAGHVVDPVALGSIEYAVEHLHVSMLLVLGHEGCGAVKAAIGGGEASPNIKSLLHRIRPAVDKALAGGFPETDQLKAAVVENVRYQMQMAVYRSEVLASFVQKKKLAIAGGVYGLATGKVDLISSLLTVDRGTSGMAEKPYHTDAHPPGLVEKTNPAAAGHHASEKKHTPEEKSHHGVEKKSGAGEKPHGAEKPQDAGEAAHGDRAAVKGIREMKWKITLISLAEGRP